MSLAIPALIGIGGAALGFCACKVMLAGINTVYDQAAKMDEGWKKTALKIFLSVAFVFNALVFSMSVVVLGPSAGILIAESLFITGIPFLAEIFFGGTAICLFLYLEELKSCAERFVEWIGGDKMDTLASNIQDL